MTTKILIENNKIVFEGHAEDTETCRTLTAICDALAVNKDFETVEYENGHAEFKRVSGGDTMMFEAIQTQLNELSAYVKTIKSCKCDLEKALADYLTKDEAAKTYEMIEAHANSFTILQETVDALVTRIVALENKAYKTLPYTVDELITKLASL